MTLPARPLFPVLFVSLIVLVVGCQDTSPKAKTISKTTSKTTSKSSDTKKSTASKPPSAQLKNAPIEKKSLPQWFEYAVNTCKIPGAGMRPLGCDGVDAQIDTMLVKQGPAALPTLIPYLTDKRDKMRHLAVWWLVTNMPKTTLHRLEKDRALVSKETAASLLATLKGDDAHNGTRARGGHVYIEFAVHLGILTDQRALVLKTIEGLQDERVKANGVGALMRYDRMKTFDEVKKYATSPLKSPIKRTALAAPLRMPMWTPKEEKVLCPWFKSHWPDAANVLDDLIAQGLMRCGGESVDVLISEADRRIKNNTFNGALAIKMGEVCARHGGAAKKRLLDGQCARIQSMFHNTIMNAKLDLKARKRMMFQLMMMNPNPDILKPYLKHPDSRIVVEANRLVKAHQALKAMKRHQTKDRP